METTIWVTADHHFGHRNIIKYCNRPFSSVEEMNHIMVEMWNAQIKDDHLVVHLGDVTLGNAGHVGHILDKLRGKKILTRGNHDQESICQHPSWLGVRDALKFNYNGRAVHMRHYPFKPEEMQDKTAVYLHGHCHGNMGIYHDRQMDVGVDCWNFSPLSLDYAIYLYDEQFNGA